MKVDEHNNISPVRVIILSAATSAVTTLLVVFCVLPYFLRDGSSPWADLLVLGGKGEQVLAYPDKEAQAADVRPGTKPSAYPVRSVAAQDYPTQSVISPQQDSPKAERTDTVELTIPPKQGLDYRLAMKRDYALDYRWTANGKTVYTELRGESMDGKKPAKTFATLTSKTGKGFFIVPFNGQFGWHWQNKTGQPIAIRLHTKGTYQVVGQVGAAAPIS